MSDLSTENSPQWVGLQDCFEKEPISDNSSMANPSWYSPLQAGDKADTSKPPPTMPYSRHNTRRENRNETDSSSMAQSSNDNTMFQNSLQAW